MLGNQIVIVVMFTEHTKQFGYLALDLWNSMLISSMFFFDFRILTAWQYSFCKAT